MTNTVSIRLADEKIAMLDSIAQQQSHSRNAIMNEAIDRYIEMHKAWVEGVEAAIAQDEAGMTSPADEAFTRLRGKLWKSD